MSVLDLEYELELSYSSYSALKLLFVFVHKNVLLDCVAVSC